MQKRRIKVKGRKCMKILAVGDIIGNAGVKELKKQLSKIKKEKKYRFYYSKW